ncbi:sulfurtransferase TusD [Rodentibacter pneumotropicus]|uniref:Sulfurtransferase complex subunit TusD n=1 Tax=Rodentibacter pneumotropicus TaxID=758 RepID=A0AAW5L8C2_9PAST|nr:sulfurtransferase complex subunit TusD [Rodentibacter pneumotropicus]MCQ9120307.1 sulfurtransferase complex subunit TusD [Rodentibacter pneumotropicus]OOF67133.1 sulfurtransferase TusD [Rodentibacter pneumotropicus]
MDYVLAVKSPVYGTQGAYLAYQFAEALIEKGHSVKQIFFFQEGVSNGNRFVYPAGDEVNLQRYWQVFSAKYGVPLCLCIAASQRRGVVNEMTAEDRNSRNLAEQFTITGLGEFMAAILNVDRVITL